MPDFSEFPTVLDGSRGRFQAIYAPQAIRYLEISESKTLNRANLGDPGRRREMDEPESLGSITLASRERLDNLIFVVIATCSASTGRWRETARLSRNWRRFSAGSMNVIQLIWGTRLGSDHSVRSRWPARPAHGRDHRRSVSEIFRRERRVFPQNFLHTDPRLLKMVEQLSDEQLARMRLGGHDPIKVHAGISRRWSTRDLQPSFSRRPSRL